MKTYIRSAQDSDIYIGSVKRGSVEDLCTYLGLVKHGNVWAGKCYQNQILVYSPRLGVDRWAMVSNFRHDFEHNTYENLLESIDDPGANLQAIEDDFGCTIDIGHCASDLVNI